MSDHAKEDCERWAEIADRRLLEEPVAEDDERFYTEHLESCDACRAEAEAWCDLAAEEREESLAKPSSSALVERALEATEAKKMPLRALDAARKARNARVGAGVGAVLALAAGVALYLELAPRAEAPSIAVLESASGDVRSDGAPLWTGARLEQGSRIDLGPGARACVAFDGGKIRSCLDERSSLSIASVAAASRRLILHEGTVVTSLEKLPTGSSFTVDALEGEAVVTGTIFSVSRLDGGKVIAVRVHEGSVRTRSKASSADVTAGNQLELGAGSPSQVEPRVRNHDLGVLGLPAPSEPTPTPAPTASTEAPTQPPPAASSIEPTRKPPSAAEMLKTARTLRAAGNANGAAEAYRALMATHPKSAEARAALLSLAELQLGALGDPAGALRSYDAYLRSGGGLSQEAQYGRIQALGRLGRSAEERAAIAEFVKAYPNSVQARTLEGRLKKAD